MAGGGGSKSSPRGPPTKPSTPPRRGGAWPSRSPGPRVGVWGSGGGVLQSGRKGAGVLVDLRAGPAWATGRSLGKENRNIKKPCPRTPHPAPRPTPDLVLRHPTPHTSHPGPDQVSSCTAISCLWPAHLLSFEKTQEGAFLWGCDCLKGGRGCPPPPGRTKPPEGWHKARGGLGLWWGPRGSLSS